MVLFECMPLFGFPKSYYQIYLGPDIIKEYY